MLNKLERREESSSLTDSEYLGPHHETNWGRIIIIYLYNQRIAIQSSKYMV